MPAHGMHEPLYTSCLRLQTKKSACRALMRDHGTHRQPQPPPRTPPQPQPKPPQRQPPKRPPPQRKPRRQPPRQPPPWIQPPRPAHHKDKACSWSLSSEVSFASGAGCSSAPSSKPLMRSQWHWLLLLLQEQAVCPAKPPFASQKASNSCVWFRTASAWCCSPPDGSPGVELPQLQSTVLHLHCVSCSISSPMPARGSVAFASAAAAAAPRKWEAGAGPLAPAMPTVASKHKPTSRTPQSIG